MNYFALDSVINAFEDNRNKTTDGFWGVMAILRSLDCPINSCVQYDINCQEVANILERWFSVRRDYKNYNTSAIWYVVFSVKWIDQLTMFLKFNPAPNIYNVIAWMYQHHGFENIPTSSELLEMFCTDTSIRYEALESLFDMTSHELRFADKRFSHDEKIKRLTALAGSIGSNNSIKSNGSYIVADAGSFQRAPFIQTLYASTENYKCLMITSVAPDEYYPDNFKENHRVFYDNVPLQQIFYGAPGTGKSFTIDDTVNDDNSVRITFHPDSDYASFVGAYKPTMKHVPMSYITKEGKIKAEYLAPTDTHPGTEEKIVYKYVPQAFLKAYVAAWSNLNKPYFLVIEEINRGNCAQIFGDLFQLLDRNNSGSSSYAIHADQDIAQFLRDDKDNGFAGLESEQRDAIAAFVLEKDNGKTENIGADILSGKKLLLPPNLFIWATMNTSDQSLFPIDSAFKRRWNWKYMPIEYTPVDKKTGQTIDWKVEIAGNLYSWGAFLAKINPEIYTLTESSDKQMGYFFAKADPQNGVISEDVFLNKVLFYLWTDIFKDYDVSSEYFKNKKKNRSFRFTDFFDKEQPTALADFIDNFNLNKLNKSSHDDFQEEVKDEDVVFDSVNDEDLNDSSRSSQRDHSRYSVNGKGRYNKSDAVVAAITAFIESLPNLSAKEILDKIKDFNLSNTLAYSEAEYQYYLNKSTDTRFPQRYARIITRTGEPIYVYRGSTPERIGELMNGLNNSGTGVTLTKIE